MASNQSERSTPGADRHARSKYAQQIRVEQIRTLNRYILPILGVNLVVGLALLYGFWRIAPQSVLYAWGSALLGMILIRTHFYIRYRSNPGTIFLPRQSRDLMIGSALSGLLWGAAGLVFFQPDALEYQLFILFILVGMGAGAITSLTAFMPVFYVFFPVSMIPMSIQLFSLGEPIQLSLGVMSVAYVIALCFFGHNINRTLIESLSLRFENIDLVDQLSTQKDQAEQANIAKSRFLAAASHDLRQPLHALTLYVSLLDQTDQDPQSRQLLHQISRSISTLQQLFNGLLDISKLDAGTLTPEYEHIPLQSILNRLNHDFSTDAHMQGLQFQIDESGEILFTDPTLFEQILRNYLANALRYTKQGSVQLTSTRQGDAVRIDVTDTGIGIPHDQQERIFSEFYQVDNPERDRSKGLGLGLAIVERISCLLNHRIEMRSSLGEGSTFSVSVPLGRAEQVNPQPKSGYEEDDRNREPLTLAVIDDDLSVRESMRALLENWGCKVIAEASINKLLSALADEGRMGPDAIIADYRLSEHHTGIEVIHELRQRFEREIPALIITGDTADKPLQELHGSGIQILHKPVAPPKFRAFLRNVQRRASKN
jgi:signal transduction histidine kinase/CheY-like chemotaxis protein